LKYILRKILIFLVTLWVAMTINFILPRMMPGNPAEALIARAHGRVSAQALHSLEVAFGVNVHQNIFVQYFEYLGRTLTGNFGISITYYPSTVAYEIETHMPWTLALIGVTTVLAFAFGTILGISTAWKRESIASTISLPVSIFFNSVPYFWLALLFQYLLAFILGWFPISGAFAATGPQGIALIGSILYHAILPASTIFITALGGWVLTMRNNMISVLSEDFVTFAYAGGLPDSVIEYNYAARNAILPNFTGFAMAIGFVVSGALLVEMVFSYPGIGYLLYQSVVNLDYPLMQALFFFITVTVLVANFIADMTYVLVDPRVRT
jgi:peptide/nickel transport system permease protein